MSVSKQIDHQDPDDNAIVRDCQSQPFSRLLEARLSRRGFLKAGSSVAMSLLVACDQQQESARLMGKDQHQTLLFKELQQGRQNSLRLAEDYQGQILLRWGDPLFLDSPIFDIHQQTATAQLRQFGFNNDFVAFLPFNKGASDHGLLIVNHEFVRSDKMFPETRRSDQLTRAQVDVEIASLGMSIIEIRLEDGQWRTQLNSSYNRRITPWTPMRIAGAAAGHRRLITQHSQDATQTLGTYGNCAGGITPWGTVLTAEENVQYFFSGNPDETDEAENHQRFGLRGHGKRTQQWGQHYSRWNLAREPAEALHVGWIVEIDPFDPESVPVKHTALGRFKHEACNTVINQSGHVIAYMGDDQRFEYIYRFVSRDRFEPDQPRVNRQLLDHGVLSVARFDDDGLQWLPLVFGRSPLDQEHGFDSQADVVLDARKAADLLGATPMDRPEDIEINPKSGEVYVMLTGNKKRRSGQTDAVNSRSNNHGGQIIKLIPPRQDHSADRFEWDVFILAGDPKNPADGAQYHPQISDQGWFARPDNAVFDDDGNLWLATDNDNRGRTTNGLWAMQCDGQYRALPKHFMSAPVGAEICGPMFTPDNTTLFCAIQHPASGWPDSSSESLARSAVVAIRHQDGRAVGR